MAKRKKTKRRPGVGDPAPDVPRRTPGPPLVEPHPIAQIRALIARARIGNAMLAECPSFAVEPDFEREDVVVGAVPNSTILCPACGITLPVAEQTRCPKMQHASVAIRLLMRPEALHAET